MDGYAYPNEIIIGWSLLIVLYPFITGLVAGAFVVSSLYHVFNMKALKPVASMSLLTALAFLLVLVALLIAGTLKVDEFPPLLEMSFIRKDLALEVRPSKKRLPIQGLDFPNKTDRPDVTWQPLTRREDHAERAF